MGNTVCLLDRFGSGCYAGMHLILDCLGAMLDVTRFIVSLYFTTLATAALVAAMAGCSVIGEGNEPWDTDIPESEAFDAADGTWGPDGIQIAFEHTPEPLGAEPCESDQLWIANL